MSGKAGPQAGSGKHGHALTEGVATAFSWLTIIPVRGATTFDRVTGRRAIASIPVVGLVPGVAAAAMILLISWSVSDSGEAAIAIGAFVAGALAVVLGLALTRAMHADGLADVTDALGSYGPPEKARAVLADASAGPVAVAAVGMTHLVQVAGYAMLAVGLSQKMLPDAPLSPLLLAATTAILPAVLSRAASMTACSTRWGPFSESGFGSLVAGTQPLWSIALWWISLAGISSVIAGWAGLAACAVAVGIAVWLGRLCNRRFGGINGDVLGTVVEVTTAATAVLLGFALVLG